MKPTPLTLSLFCAAALLTPSLSFAEAYCSVTSNFDNTYGGRGATELEARTNALQACAQGAGNGMFCENKVICQETGQPSYAPWLPAPATYYCSVTSNFDNTYGGRGHSEVEARTIALQACAQGAGNGIFCDNAVTCQKE